MQGKKTEPLAFTIRVAKTADDYRDVARLRAKAYGRHIPELEAKLSVPEAVDFQPGVVVLIARSRLDGSAIGTVRIQTNMFKPLQVQGEVALPASVNSKRLAEATRLACESESNCSVVRVALVKAYSLICEDMGVDMMVVCSRRPLARFYVGFGCKDLVEEGKYFNLSYAADLPHRVLGRPVVGGLTESHRFYAFFYGTHHPDIDLAGARDMLEHGAAIRPAPQPVALPEEEAFA